MHKHNSDNVVYDQCFITLILFPLSGRFGEKQLAVQTLSTLKMCRLAALQNMENATCGLYGENHKR